MSNAQRVIMLVGMVILIAMLLYPPWIQDFGDRGSEFKGYAFLFTGPTYKTTEKTLKPFDLGGGDIQLERKVTKKETFCRIYIEVLVVQVLIVLVVGAGAILAVKPTKIAIE